MLRVNGPDELPDDLSGIVGVTAGASAPEELVDAVIAHLAPAHGVEEVRITDEDEYFPPPRELRDLLAAIDVVATFTLGGSVPDRPTVQDRAGRRQPGPGDAGLISAVTTIADALPCSGYDSATGPSTHTSTC